MKKSELQRIIKEEVDNVLMEGLLDSMPLMLSPIGQQMGLTSLLGRVLDFSDDDRSLKQRIEAWWQSRKDDKVLNKIAARIKDDPEVQTFVRQPYKKGWKKMLASKLTPEEQRYVNLLYRQRFRDLANNN